MHQSQASNLNLVSVSVLRRLLRNNEAVLLYPGGVREAYKNKNEKYQVTAGGNAHLRCLHCVQVDSAMHVCAAP